VNEDACSDGGVRMRRVGVQDIGYAEELKVR
jgi:hypothetical protein